MDFIDEAKITIKAGNGGNGCVSFRREKYVSKGGPDGGNGGRGGHIIFETQESLSTLRDFKYQRHYQAENGHSGQGQQRTGRGGQDLVIGIPPGTCIFNDDNRQRLADLDKKEMRLILAKGGRGGRGNLTYVSSTNRAPRKFETGQTGESLSLQLQLKLLGDVAMVGLPNAGKSTLLQALSKARPKIADYPFTTLTPQLGVSEIGSHQQRRHFVIADIPGLIAGAHQGKGLGLKFLKHLERSKVLWFVIDCQPKDNQTQDPTQNPLTDFKTLRAELGSYRADLLDRPAFLLLNKMDTHPPEESTAALRDQAAELGIPTFVLSGLSRTGLKDLGWETAQLLDRLKPAC